MKARSLGEWASKANHGDELGTLTDPIRRWTAATSLSSDQIDMTGLLPGHSCRKPQIYRKISSEIVHPRAAIEPSTGSLHLAVDFKGIDETTRITERYSGFGESILYTALDKTFFFDLSEPEWGSPMTETAWNV
jgi:hypothetical protein